MSAAFAASLRMMQGATTPEVNFPTGPRERLSIATYPFRSVIISPVSNNGAHGPLVARAQMTLAEFAKTIPGQFDVHGIEPWSHHFESNEPAYVTELGRAFESAKLRVVNIPCDVRDQFCGTPEELTNALDTCCKWVDAAVILHAPSIRVHVPSGSTPNNLNCTVDGLKAVAEYGAKKNIVINLENDNPRTEDPFQIVKIIETANTPFLRALPDFGNSRQLGDEEYNERALKALFAHAFNISHVKTMETIRGQELRNDPDRIFAIAKNAGYRGYFSMEWDSTGADPYEATRQLIALSLKNLAA